MIVKRHIDVKVKQVNIIWDTLKPLVYPAALSFNELNAKLSENIPGKFVYFCDGKNVLKGDVLDATEAQPYQAEFVDSDIKNSNSAHQIQVKFEHDSKQNKRRYRISAAVRSLVIYPNKVRIVWSAPDEMMLGERLNDLQLNAQCMRSRVDNSFTRRYNPAKSIIDSEPIYSPEYGEPLLESGLRSLTVTFRLDRNYYPREVNKTVVVNVRGKTPTIRWDENRLRQIEYGDPLQIGEHLRAIVEPDIDGECKFDPPHGYIPTLDEKLVEKLQGRCIGHVEFTLRVYFEPAQVNRSRYGPSKHAQTTIRIVRNSSDRVEADLMYVNEALPSKYCDAITYVPEHSAYFSSALALQPRTYSEEESEIRGNFR